MARGSVHIERENSDGDRRIVRTIDVEGLLAGVDRYEYIGAAMREVLADPDHAAYLVRALDDDGRTLRKIRV